MHIFSAAGRRALTVLTLAVVVALPGTAVPQQYAGYVSARQVAQECRMSVFFEELSNRLRLEEEDTQVVVTPGLDLAIFDGETVKLEARVKLARGEVQIPESFAAVLKERLQRKRDERRKKEKAAQAQGKRLTKVVIDPGHGGKFPGACAHGLQEKEINLAVSRMVKDILEEHGLEVIMTRSRDVELSQDHSRDLDLRCEVANTKRADIFVSIHANAGPPSATGFEVFVARPDDELEAKSEKAARETPVAGEDLGGKKKSGRALDEIVWRALLKEHYSQSMELARKLSEGLQESIGEEDNNRGVDNEHGFRVTKWTRCPAVLVEMGFVSNRATARKLATDRYRKEIAEGIAGGILEFKKEYDATCGFTRPGGEGVSE